MGFLTTWEQPWSRITNIPLYHTNYLVTWSEGRRLSMAYQTTYSSEDFDKEG